MDYNSFSSVSGAALTGGNFWRGAVRTFTNSSQAIKHTNSIKLRTNDT